VRAAAVATVLVLALAGCSDDGGDDDETDDRAGDHSGCLVEPDRVTELLGYEVVVQEGKVDDECRFEPADPAAHPGAEVAVAERELADDGEAAFEAARAAVEADAGPTTPIGSQDVDHADRGWIARVGRAVQVGVTRDRRLVLVTVVDGTLDAAGAEDVAFELAGRALE
jgi:hypothetical protein